MLGFPRLAPAVVLVALAACSSSPPDMEVVGVPGTATAPRGERRSLTGDGAGGEKIKPAEILAEAKRSYENGNLGGAAMLFEEVVKVEPRNREALFLLAMVNLDRAEELVPDGADIAYLRSAWAIRQIRSNFNDLTEQERTLLPLILYHEAVALARQNKTEPALKSLGEAVDAGFTNAKKVSAEPALESVRKLPPYHDLVERMAAQLKKRADERMKTILSEKAKFPFEFSLPGLDDKTVSSADFRGKVLIVDIWGTWCPPCRREIPHFVSLYKKYHDKGLEIVGINYEQVAENQDPRPMIASFAKANEMPYPCVIGDDKTKAQVRGFEGFPTTLYLDRAGQVRAMVVGFNPEDPVDSTVMENLVETLLAEGAGDATKRAP